MEPKFSNKYHNNTTKRIQFQNFQTKFSKVDD